MKHFVVIGSGARELSIVEAILRSLLFRSIKEAVIDVLPGGGGSAWLALQGLPVKNHNIKATDVAGIVKFCIDNAAEFVFIGPEAPLVGGLVDRLEDEGICVFGPRQSAAIEGSKAEQKRLMALAGIPTADYGVFTDCDLAIAYVEQHGATGFIKADGLCGGKGVEKYETVDAGIAILKRFMIDGCHGDAGRKVVIESPLEGGNAKEVSLMILCDGTGHYEILLITQDHKPVGEGDAGKNTGGMGAWGPVLWAERYLSGIKKTIIEPMLKAIALGRAPFKGCLYAGLMITLDGPKVVEWNVRFGDPEGPVIIDLLSDDVDVLALLMACAKGKLAEFGPITVKPGFTVCVVLCAQGYGYGTVIAGDEVFGIKEADKLPGVKIILAGTVLVGQHILTASGRAVYVVAHAETLGAAIKQANAAAEIVKFRGKHYRTDIGAKSLAMI